MKMMLNVLASRVAAVASVGELVSPSQLLFIGGVVLITLLLLRSNRRRSSRGGPSPKVYADELLAGTRQQQEVRASMEGLLVQIQEVASEISAAADTKLRVLRAALDEADDQIQTLRELSAKSDRAHGDAERTLPPSDRSSPVSARSQSRTNIPEATPFAFSTNPTPRDIGAMSRISETVKTDIVRLAAEGVGVVDIARKTGRSIAEVQLILDVHAATAKGR